MSAQPTAASAPIRLGVSRSPARTTDALRAMSAPRGVMFWPAAALAKIDISFSPSIAVSSTITTASAPAGVGAPVAISAHVPLTIVVFGI